MSRLSKILCVKEGQEFGYAETDRVYKVEREFLYYREDKKWTILTGRGIYLMIENPDKIYSIPEKPQLTEQQITAIKGRIAEGTPWAVRNSDKAKSVFFFIHKPCFSERYESWCGDEDSRLLPDSVSGNSMYNFVTELNSPVYLPELVGE